MFLLRRSLPAVCRFACGLCGFPMAVSLLFRRFPFLFSPTSRSFSQSVLPQRVAVWPLWRCHTARIALHYGPYRGALSAVLRARWVAVERWQGHVCGLQGSGRVAVCQCALCRFGHCELYTLLYIYIVIYTPSAYACAHLSACGLASEAARPAASRVSGAFALSARRGRLMPVVWRRALRLANPFPPLAA